MSTPYDDVVKATGGLASRAGAVKFYVTYSPVAPVTQFFAYAEFEGGGLKRGSGANIGLACEDLAVELLEGTTCGRCNHVIGLFTHDPRFCQWRRVGDVWRSGCGMPRDRSIKLASAA